MKTQANAKIPGFTLLYCCTVILGGITTISTILSMSGNYIFFYLFFLIPPILQFIAFFSRNNRLLLVGFYGAVCLHIIEYVSGGILYGFDRLFSAFGSNIIGYFIAVIIWWCYFHFSKKVAAYFHVERVTSWKSPFSSTSSSVEAPIISNPTATTSSLNTYRPTSLESRSSHFLKTATNTASSSSPSPRPPWDNQSATVSASLRSPFKINSTIIVFVLTILLLISGILNFYQFLITQNNRSEISKSLQDISALQEKVDSQKRTISSQENKYKELQEKYSESSYSLFILKYHAFYILDDGTKYYHFYDCPLVKAYSGEFWVHNSEYCQYLGYAPCPYCSPV